MVQDDDFNLAIIHGGFQSGKELVAETLFDGIDNRRTLTAFDQIGVVGSAVCRTENDIPPPQTPARS